MSDAQALPMSSIRDNQGRGRVGDFLKEHIRKDAHYLECQMKI
jgi:hypothetical protein